MVRDDLDQYEIHQRRLTTLADENGRAGKVERSNDLMNDDSRMLLCRVGKAQIDGIFARQDKGPAVDDSEFLPFSSLPVTPPLLAG
jgi:hypothetical protein